ncbi:hypothetical protein B0H14DRAFT_751096 [Mycena olivaceomarginata]|nr:hypothetical protein B0H14DRAFT_751096 [Mycena olivaceomarginata]
MGLKGRYFTPFLSFFGGNAPTGGRQCTGQDGIILDASPIPKVFHPSQVIHMHLLRKAPHARVAIVHDDDWCNVLLNHEVPLTEQEFIQAIFDRSEITVEDGMVFLSAKSEVPPLESEGSLHTLSNMSQVLIPTSYWRDCYWATRSAGTTHGSRVATGSQGAVVPLNQSEVKEH